MSWKSVVKDFVPPIALRVLRPPGRVVVTGSNVYASARDTIEAAENAGLKCF